MSETLEINKAIEGLNKIEGRITAIEENVKAGRTSAAEAEKAIKEIGEKQVAFARQLLEIQQAGVKNAADAQGGRTVGEIFTKSESYKAFRGMTGARAASFVVANKDVAPITSAAAHQQSYRVPGIVPQDEPALVIEGLLPHIHTGAESISWLRETEFTNAAAPTAEGALKPFSTLKTEVMTVPVQVIPHFTKITKQLADDDAALSAFINMRMVDGVNRAAEAQILAGDGTGVNLTGLMKAGNFIDQKLTLAQVGGKGSNLFDLLRMCFAQVKKMGHRVPAVVLNPVDWALMQGLKDSSGAYLIGSPSDTAPARVCGATVIEAAGMPEGKFLAGDFSRAAMIYDREETVIDIATQNEDDFVRNVYTIRAERRLACVVDRPGALIGGALVVPAA